MKKAVYDTATKRMIEVDLTPEELADYEQRLANATRVEQELFLMQEKSPEKRLAKLEAELEKALKRIEALEERKG